LSDSNPAWIPVFRQVDDLRGIELFVDGGVAQI
jgi:hypothetical protein